MTNQEILSRLEYLIPILEDFEQTYNMVISLPNSKKNDL